MNTPGYKTKSFWLTAAAMLAAVVATVTGTDPGDTGVVGTGLALVVGVAGAALYTGWRAMVKRGDDAKPWWKQTEFWLSVAAAVTALLIQSDVLATGGTAYKVVSAIAGILASLGFAASQGGQRPEA